MKKLFQRKRGWLLILVGLVLIHVCESKAAENVSKEQIQAAASLFGLEFTEEEIELMLQGRMWNVQSYEKLRSFSLENSLAPAFQFNPLPRGYQGDTRPSIFRLHPPRRTTVPEPFEQLAFYSVRDLSYLIQTRQVTSTQLTRLYLKRLKAHDAQLHCVITLTEDLALRRAAQADEEIASGTYRGPLHGIPYGVKDLLALQGYKTTWGAMPYKDQVIDQTATVIKKLDQAGAVLVAKLTLGALAMGDVWYGGKTRSPWNLERGSSGSSAGPAAATAAGLVAFAIGSETNGSIVSPSFRCGVTGLRPTFGRISRAGAMTLSWTMDKLGPICRTVEDCAIVFNAIHGPDGIDPTVVDAPFRYPSQRDVSQLRIGYLKTEMEKTYPNQKYDRETVDVFRKIGAHPIPAEFPDLPASSLYLILEAEAAAAFDELTRSNRDDLLVRQDRGAWPNQFRKARLIPAVEYIQANRIRSLLISKMANIMKEFDVVIAPAFGGNTLLLTNLTGHPCITLPNGFTETNEPVGITLIGQLYGEGTLLTAAKAYQDATDFHRKHPSLD